MLSPSTPRWTGTGGTIADRQWRGGSPFCLPHPVGGSDGTGSRLRLCRAGRSGKVVARQRPLFEQMKRDALQRKFDRLRVWKVAHLGRDMHEVIATVYELADLG